VSPRLRRKPGVAASALAAVLFGAPVARGDGAVRVVTLGAGPDGAAIASAAVARASAETADAAAFRGAFGPAGARLLPLATKRRDKNIELVARARTAARVAHADKAILVQVEKGRGKGVVHVWVVDAQGSDGALIDQEVRLDHGASVSEETDAVWAALASAFPSPAETPAEPAASALAPPAPAAPVPAPATPAPLANVSERPPDADTGPVADASRVHEHTRAEAYGVLRAGVEAGSRHFSYVDRLTPTLRPYDLFAAPLVTIDGEIYPLAGTSIPVLSGLGATGRYARAFGLASADSAGTKVGTSWQAFDLGLRERLPLTSWFILGIDAGYGDTSFALDQAIQPSAQLPSVHYKVLRGGVDGRFGRRDLSLQLGARYLDVLSTGDLAALFPHAKVGGVEAMIEVAYMIARGVELSLDVAYTRYFYSLLPVPGDAYVAGGALDEMASVSLGVAYLF
jgi:hypothetical protein